jgi:hypothetical protein
LASAAGAVDGASAAVAEAELGRKLSTFEYRSLTIFLRRSLLDAAFSLNVDVCVVHVHFTRTIKTHRTAQPVRLPIDRFIVVIFVASDFSDFFSPG